MKFKYLLFSKMIGLRQSGISGLIINRLACTVKCGKHGLVYSTIPSRSDITSFRYLSKNRPGAKSKDTSISTSIPDASIESSKVKSEFSTTNISTVSTSQHASNRQRLDEYFNKEDFSFAEGREEQTIQRLRKYMETVYLKERPLVAVDVEAWEKNLKKVTEIGISVYDPRLQSDSPFPLIKTFHLIVKENLQFNNGKYVPDNKKKFMGGTSRVLSFKESKEFVQLIVEQYINVSGGALVGHQIDGDIKWLKSIGVSLSDALECVDTLKIHSFSRATGGTLRGILRTVGIPHANLHNAANDAYYTLLAALAYCDPAFRTHYNLDIYCGETSKLTPAEKKHSKFLDLAKFDSKATAKELYEDLF